jgi:DNA-binding GntR family transcriptional regulator
MADPKMAADTKASNLHRLPQEVVSQNLPNYVHDVLLEAILSNVLSPGERLLVDDIAQHFGISKIPVREALRSLEAAGWLDSRPRRGTYVRPLSQVELEEVFEMRQILEPFAARMAAQRRTDEHLSVLQELLAAGERSLEDHDLRENLRVNSRFHTVIAEAVGNALLANTLKDLQLRVRRYYSDLDWKARRSSFDEHRNIYEAIRDRDADRAEQLTIEHVEHTWALAERKIALQSAAEGSKAAKPAEKGG